MSALHQDMAVVPKTFLQRVFRRGVGHLVDVDHHVIGVAQQMSHHRGADKSAPAGQQKLHGAAHPCHFAAGAVTSIRPLRQPFSFASLTETARPTLFAHTSVCCSSSTGPKPKRSALRPGQNEMEELFGGENGVLRRQRPLGDGAVQQGGDQRGALARPGLAHHQRQFRKASAFRDQQAVQCDRLRRQRHRQDAAKPRRSSAASRLSASAQSPALDSHFAINRSSTARNSAGLPLQRAYSVRLATPQVRAIASIVVAA